MSKEQRIRELERQVDYLQRQIDYLRSEFMQLKVRKASRPYTPTNPEERVVRLVDITPKVTWGVSPLVVDVSHVVAAAMARGSIR